MKKISLSFIAFLFLSLSVFAQESKILFSPSELAALGKSWGFLKYHHPAISQGKLAWDSLLIASLKSPKKQSVSQVVANWLSQADLVKVNPPTAISLEKKDSVDNRNLNQNWIKDDPYLNASQKKYFSQLGKAAEPVGTYYSYAGGNRYSASREKTYKDLSAPYRLLGLFRFWNTIEYFYPYKYAIGEPWGKTLNRLLPETLMADDEIKQARLIARFAASIHDTHAEVTPGVNDLLFGKLGPPFKFKVIDYTVVITKIADSARCAKSGLALGDLISKVNGKTIREIIDQNSQYIAASNESIKIRDAFYYIFNGNEAQFSATGQKKNGGNFTTTVGRMKRDYESEWDKEGNPDNKLAYFDPALNRAVYTHILPGNIGYIDRSSIVNKDVDSIFKGMMNTRGLILDLRGYSNGPVSLKPFSYLLPKPAPYGKMSQADFNKPGAFYYVGYILGTETMNIKTIGQVNPDHYKGRVILLVNESTQSAEELWAMLYKTVPGALVVGSQTAGADGNKTLIKTFGNFEIFMSGIGIFYPDGKETQRIGIVPDVLVKPGIRDMQEQKDVLVEKAIEVINQGR